MKVYLISNSERNLDEVIAHINFDMVLVNDGHFSSKTAFWMRWCKDESNERIYHKFDQFFKMQDKNVFLTQGIFVPERWLWEGSYENILICGVEEDLMAYARALLFHNPASAPKTFPVGSVYKLDIERVENQLKVRTHGFLYHSTP